MSRLQGTRALLWPTARRDALRIGLWVGAIVALAVFTAASTKSLYPTAADLRKVAAFSLDNPAAAAFNGPLVALDTLGGQVAFQLGSFGLTMVGLMSVLLTSRMTRGEEDSGRLELVRSMPVGSHAPLAAAVVVVGVVDVVLGAGVALGLAAEGLPTSGSIAMGTSFTVLGWFFTGCTAALAQVSENPRVGAGAAGAVLGAAYAIRAAGDAGSGSLSWLSPIGLAQKARPYAGDVWWPMLLCAALAVALVAAAAVLSARRDFGAGLVQARPGHAHAAPSLSGTLGLAVRLQRATVLWWSVGVVAMGVVCGSLVASIQDFATQDSTISDYLQQGHASGITDAYLATSLLIVGLMCAGAAVHLVLRLRSEEAALRAEWLLSTPTARLRWLGGHLAVTLAGSGVALLAGALGLGITTAIALGDAGQVPRLLADSLVQLPALWLLVAIGVALVGFVPRASTAVWGWWTLSLIVAFFGTLIDLPGFVHWLSPFEHVPFVPGERIDVAMLALLTATAVALVAAGAVGLRHRDLRA